MSETQEKQGMKPDKEELKKCPKCKSDFSPEYQCAYGCSPFSCWCEYLDISQKKRDEITKEQYETCLCPDCLRGYSS